MKKVCFVSLGCPKNLVDSEVMMGSLAEAGYEITSNAEEAETVVVPETVALLAGAVMETVGAVVSAGGAVPPLKATAPTPPLGPPVPSQPALNGRPVAT